MSGYGFSAGYDAEDRLTSWNRSDTNLDQFWNLSPVGDWNSVTENAAVQKLLAAASQSVQHDVKGNMTLIPPVLRPGSDPRFLIVLGSFGYVDGPVPSSPFVVGGCQGAGGAPCTSNNPGIESTGGGIAFRFFNMGLLLPIMLISA